MNRGAWIGFYFPLKRWARAACTTFIVGPLAFCAIAGAHDPFPAGYSMGNSGAIMQSSGLSGRQPWVPASFLADTFRFGVSVCGIDYYDAMDNLESSHIVQALAGAWYAHRRFVFKASYAHLNALGLYYEQQGFISVGFLACRALSASIEVTANRAGLTDERTEQEKFLNAGVSLFVSGKSTALSVSCGRLPIKSVSIRGFEPPIAVDIGLHTAMHRFGAQGVRCEITKDPDYAFRFSIAESYSLSDYCAVCGALSTAPFMMHVGISFSNARHGVALSFVNHPALGWSRGLTVGYAHR
jgi:hypothetical protein